MDRPLFSCVVPVKGPRPYLAEALASLEAQGFGERLEVIVQDGDSEPDNGQGDALNRGFAKARGEWLFWLNADDFLQPGALGRVAAMAETDPTLRWIAGGTVYVDADGRKVDERGDFRWHSVFYRHLPVWTFGPSAFFRRELWDWCGGFDTNLRFVLDIDLWTRWARLGESYAMAEGPLWGFRCHEGSLTMGTRNAEAFADEKRRWLQANGFRRQWFWRNLLRLVQRFDRALARLDFN